MDGLLAQMGTTGFILGWSVLLSLLLVGGIYEKCAAELIQRAMSDQSGARIAAGRRLLPGLTLIPPIMLVPVLIWGAYGGLGVSLIFGPRLISTPVTTGLHAALPAGVLLIGAGFVTAAKGMIEHEIRFWASKPFVLLSQSLGKDLKAELRMLVMVRSFTDLWAKVLPWFFGELVVVEALLNVPGLGLTLWEAARRLDHGTVAASLGAIVALFFVTLTANRSLSHWLSQRLESYG